MKLIVTGYFHASLARGSTLQRRTMEVNDGRRGVPPPPSRWPWSLRTVAADYRPGARSPRGRIGLPEATRCDVATARLSPHCGRKKRSRAGRHHLTARRSHVRGIRWFETSNVCWKMLAFSIDLCQIYSCIYHHPRHRHYT